MSQVNELLQVCGFCEKRPVTVSYTRAGHTEMVCGSCLDQQTARDALDDKLIHIVALERDKKYDEALACLDAIWEANRHLDHDGWLARSIANHRGHILFDAGRYTESKQAFDTRAQLGFENVTDRWALGLAMGRLFEAMGRHHDALAAYEEALSHQDPHYLSNVAYFLDALVEFSKNAGQPVNEKWRLIAQAVAADYKVEMPVREALGESLSALAEITRKMPAQRTQERYANDMQSESK